MALRHAYVQRGVSVRGEGRKATGVCSEEHYFDSTGQFNPLFPSAIPLMMKQVEKD